MVRITAILVLLVSSGACTIERIYQDVRTGTDFLKLTNATEVVAPSRWQLSTSNRIAVSEISPASRGDWLMAAREGIGSVFGLQASAIDQDGAPPAELSLFIAWPGDRLESAQNNGFAPYLRTGTLMLGANPMSVRVYLCDARSQTLIQAVTLNLNPRWLSGEATRDRHIRHAFGKYAKGLVARY